MITPPRARYRLRLSLMESEPQVWRLLDVDGSLRLDEFHDVIQIAMGWRDSHLHQFVEVSPFGPRHPLSELGREPLRWTMDDPMDDDPGLQEHESTIASAFAQLGGPLYYEYDFGDGWTHEIELIETETELASTPRAVLLSGELRGPLEDSGGPSGYRDVVDAFADPTHPEHEKLHGWVKFTLGAWEQFDPNALDVEHVNRELALRFDESADATKPTLLTDLASGLPVPLQREFRANRRIAGLNEAGPAIDEASAAAMVEPFAWLIRKVGPDGLALSKAGWMPPAVVNDAMRELGWQKRWYGQYIRENQTLPILNLRAAAQRLGLLRKFKGRLMSTTVAKQMVDDPIELWQYLATALITRQRTKVEKDATILLAVEVAAAHHEKREQYSETIAFGLHLLGWRLDDGTPLDHWDVHDAIRDSWNVMTDLNVFEAEQFNTGPVTEGGRAFALAMLRTLSEPAAQPGHDR